MGMTSWWGWGGDGDGGHGDGVKMGKEMCEWGGNGDEMFYRVILYCTTKRRAHQHRPKLCLVIT